jgi:hypothetical protein
LLGDDVFIFDNVVHMYDLSFEPTPPSTGRAT